MPQTFVFVYAYAKRKEITKYYSFLYPNNHSNTKELGFFVEHPKRSDRVLIGKGSFTVGLCSCWKSSYCFWLHLDTILCKNVFIYFPSITTEVVLLL